jgi:hypothetical protein
MRTGEFQKGHTSDDLVAAFSIIREVDAIKKGTRFGCLAYIKQPTI